MIIVITGASKGIGKAVAQEFAAEGHQLFLCSRNEHQLYETVQELQSRFPSSEIKGKPTDLSNRGELNAFAEWVTSYGTPDLLVNNAGVFIPGSIHNEPEAALETSLSVNLLSAYHLTRSFLPGMMSRKSGHIFNICSIASIAAYPNGGAYSISKFALLGFSKNLREEMKPFGIKVTSILPGAAYTDSWASSGVDPNRLMEAKDIAVLIASSSRLSAQACVEDIVLRPQLGDL
ncbi:SDR family oxidoreductase [Flavihumibacter sp. UBA7668]|uniref:SDR family oxidoreductase n=1 Tax=Flavihumibacter sp. UBA7668 TaxID=1946542 RepID=UPI0025C3BFA7|nr:SDR family oxidoreductase [Flavihumibacter sp. UBA7668]